MLPGRRRQNAGSTRAKLSAWVRCSFSCVALWDSIWRKQWRGNGNEESKRAEKLWDSSRNILKREKGAEFRLSRKNQKIKNGFLKKTV